MMIKASVEALVNALKVSHMTLATAESCTGGGVGYYLTSIPGASSVYLGGITSYANSVKERVLGVPSLVLKEYGAVSEQTAFAMAKGARELLHADIALSITGIAGPASDDTAKPVGLVYVGAASAGGVVVEEHHFAGDRETVRRQSIEAALQLALDVITK